MKLRTRKFASLAGISLAVCLFSGTSWAGASDQCGNAQGLTEFLDTSALQQKCPSLSSGCRGQIEQISQAAKEYDTLTKETCNGINEKLRTIKNVSQDSSLSNIKDNMDYAKERTDAIVAANDRIKKKVMAAMKPGIKTAESKIKNIRTANDPQRAKDERIVSSLKNDFSREALASSPFDRSKASGVSASEVRAELFAPAVGTEVIKALEEDKKHRQEFSLNAEEAAKNAEEAKNKFTTGDGNDKSNATEKKSGGLMDSLMNPSTLLGLAGAGASLLAAQKKDSGVSDAIPEAPAPAAPVAPIPATSLGSKDSSSAGQKLQMSNEAKKSDAAAAPPENYAGEAYTPIDSDVTEKTHTPSLNTSPQAATGGASGAPGAFGGSSGEEKSPREPASAALQAKAAEDYSGGFSSGGGALNFGGSSSSEASDSGSLAPEDPLRDTLHDAIAAGDSPTEPDNSSQANTGGLEEENSEVLFTRVKSCIQRSVKRGLVISGLTAKIR